MAEASSSSSGRFMIYGANGYTGRLAAAEAKHRGLEPVLAGRSRDALAALGNELGLESRAFDLAHPETVETQLRDIDLVLHCAGPFSATSKPMLDGCARSGTHYLDITGEIEVFEAVHGASARWKDAGIVAMPGVGFDVVPTDCLAAMLKAAMPDAVRLRLAFQSSHGKSSPGTAKTMVEGLSKGGMVRKDGQLVKTRAAHKVILVPFRNEPEPAVAIPWGDVSTAYHSTGIPNIETFVGLPSAMIWQMRAIGPVGFAFGLPPIQRLLKGMVTKRIHGPTPEERAQSETRVWGQVANAAGQKLAMRMRTPEGYDFTVDSSLAAVVRVLDGQVKPGAWTPSKGFGADFVRSLSGVSVETLA